MVARVPGALRVRTRRWVGGCGGSRRVRGRARSQELVTAGGGDGRVAGRVGGRVGGAVRAGTVVWMTWGRDGIALLYLGRWGADCTNINDA